MASAASVLGLLGITFALLDERRLIGFLGLVLALRALLAVVLLPIFGRIVIRTGPVPILLVASGTYVVAQAALGTIIVHGSLSLTLLLATSVVLGCADAATIPSSTAFVPLLAAGSELVRLNAWVSSAGSISKVVGAALGGVLAATASPGVLLLSASASYVVQLGTVAYLGRGRKNLNRSSRDVTSKTAIEELRRNRWIVYVASAASVVQLAAWAPYTVVGPQLAATYYGGASSWAIFTGAYGLGAAVTAIVFSARPPSSMLRMTIFSLPLWCLPPIAMGTRQGFLLVSVSAVVAGCGTALFNVCWISLLQKRLSQENLAQVVAWVSVGPQLVAPLGLLLAGTVRVESQQLQLLLLGSTIAAVASFLLWVAPSVRRSAAKAG